MDILAKDWPHLQEILFHNTYNNDLERFRSNYVYRGLSSANYMLYTSLMRLGGSYKILEKHLLRNFKKYAHNVSVPEQSYWNWISLAQHYGLPTRLLDWTYSPYIALHFATSNLRHFDKDGVIWALDYVKIKDFLPDKYRQGLENEGSNVFTPEILQDVCKNLTDLDSYQKDAFILCLEPPALDERIIQQHALFSIINNPEMIYNEFLNLHPECFFRIIIPKGLKWEIRDKLDQANITERVIYPGMNGLSLWLKRHYSPKEIPALKLLDEPNFL